MKAGVPGSVRDPDSRVQGSVRRRLRFSICMGMYICTLVCTHTTYHAHRHTGTARHRQTDAADHSIDFQM